MKIITTTILLCLSVICLYANPLSGKLITENGDPIPMATVVLLELDEIIITETDGTFYFSEVPDEDYTLLFIAPGFIEQEMPINFSPTLLTITLLPEVVEMDTIVVQAKAEDPLEIVKEGVTSEELERLPPRSDPFEALPQERGILSEIDASGGLFSGQTENLQETLIGVVSETRASSRNNGVSVYGGESDWNNYYYDYIRIPTNTHIYGYPTPGPIIPVEAVDSIDIYRGAVPVEYGPGIGGVFTMNPKGLTNDLEVTITPSIMDVSGITSMQLTDDFGFLFSFNQSLIDYTIIPLMSLLLGLDTVETEDELEEGENPTNMSYGDLLLSLKYTPPNNSISLDLMGFYDKWGFDITIPDTESGLSSNYNPYFMAGGIKWFSSLSDSLSNSLKTFVSYYKTDQFFDLHFEDFFQYKIDSSSTVTTAQLGDEIQWIYSPDTSFLGGLMGRYSILSASYKDDYFFTIPDISYTQEYDNDIPFDEKLYSTYGYAKMIGNVSSFDYKLGTGLLWYPVSNTFRPSLEGELVYSSDRLTSAVSTGWSPGLINESIYTERRLDEIYYETETVTTQGNPPMAVSLSGLVNYAYNENSSIQAAPYIAYYYDLSGVNLSTSYTDDETFISLNPFEGYSTGFDIKWSTKLGQSWDFDLSYAFSWTRYNTKTLDWVTPDTEVRHALKSSALYAKEGFKIALNFMLYSGLPFTPEVVVEGVEEAEIQQGDYNSAINYVPIYELTTNLSYDWHFEKFDFSLFMNSGNWIDALNVVMLGLDPSLYSTVGSSSADFDSRIYAFSYTYIDALYSLMVCETGMSFSF